MAVTGLMVLGRSIKLTTKFVSPSNIPLDFIRKNVKLRGRLHRVTERGLELEHIPITIPLISRWKSQPYEVLLIKIARVELTDAGPVCLRNELRPYRTLWFQLLARENLSLLCYLLMNRGMYFTVSLNEEILRRGLGRTVLIKELDHNSKAYWTIHKNLLRAELEAVRTGAGIWKEEIEKLNHVEKFKDSWREIWTKENPFKRRLSWRLNPEKESYYEKLKQQSENYKSKVSNCTFILKVREVLSHVKLGRR
ncbi:LOW QUALITY PROTEIN: protein C3orf33 homolog [Macrotis lagotis]|uniref:LOW QUALITY PROTEIN: protein C3orf33 homolog n=1 Tax=Macrotis lagotis TaxID=92651 RepID=UPI003D691CC6